MKIEGFCRTNIDEYKREKWPTAFAFPPRVGDSVQAQSGRKLKVVQVTHYIAEYDGQPGVEVELHRG